LEKETVIIGVHDRAEIWSAAAWNAQEEEMSPEKMAACMAELGF
ncbi:MAG: division/cell wall cluster transcriptional repressor MraZ, partial [Lawsonibacter sp.]|nr:division/cell wall cluster transcriptional repressor MraZ [Lawsonibacter sp.]